MVYCLFLVLLSIFVNLNFKNKLNFKENLVYYILTVYFISQIPGLLFTENSIQNISFIISSITFILTIILINHYFDDTKKNNFLLISFVILFTVFTISIFPKIVDFFKGISMYGGYIIGSEVFVGKTHQDRQG